MVSQELEQLANQDSKFMKSRMTIGIKNFNMKININQEQKKMKAMRKIGDRTGIGFSQAGESEFSKKEKQQT